MASRRIYQIQKGSIRLNFFNDLPIALSAAVASRAYQPRMNSKIRVRLRARLLPKLFQICLGNDNIIANAEKILQGGHPFFISLPSLGSCQTNPKKSTP